ncbi:hypothetical protein [Halomarina oriensis]|uniref:Uncharacterized protein n=1 Tax=Halomarina oriensis TaxID=671145 RepID=A0A6B0GV65_9EURY|nr:hypothetical protein [Halomarina oriensis]MWG36473.1 hypothetical protein [Halomarina oriensis]
MPSLPITDYDDLSIADVTDRLGGLPDAELSLLADYEATHKARVGLLDDGPLAAFAPIGLYAVDTPSADEQTAIDARTDALDDPDARLSTDAVADTLGVTPAIRPADDHYADGTRLRVRSTTHAVAGYQFSEPERTVTVNARVREAIDDGTLTVVRHATPWE